MKILYVAGLIGVLSIQLDSLLLIGNEMAEPR